MFLVCWWLSTLSVDLCMAPANLRETRRIYEHRLGRKRQNSQKLNDVLNGAWSPSRLPGRPGRSLVITVHPILTPYMEPRSIHHRMNRPGLVCSARPIPTAKLSSARKSSPRDPTRYDWRNISTYQAHPLSPAVVSKLNFLPWLGVDFSTNSRSVSLKHRRNHPVQKK